MGICRGLVSVGRRPSPGSARRPTCTPHLLGGRGCAGWLREGSARYEEVVSQDHHRPPASGTSALELWDASELCQ